MSGGFPSGQVLPNPCVGHITLYSTGGGTILSVPVFHLLWMDVIENLPVRGAVFGIYIYLLFNILVTYCYIHGDMYRRAAVYFVYVHCIHLYHYCMYW